MNNSKPLIGRKLNPQNAARIAAVLVDLRICQFRSRDEPYNLTLTRPLPDTTRIAARQAGAANVIICGDRSLRLDSAA